MNEVNIQLCFLKIWCNVYVLEGLMIMPKPKASTDHCMQTATPLME